MSIMEFQLPEDALQDDETTATTVVTTSVTEPSTISQNITSQGQTIDLKSPSTELSAIEEKEETEIGVSPEPTSSVDKEPTHETSEPTSAKLEKIETELTSVEEVSSAETGPTVEISEPTLEETESAEIIEHTSTEVGVTDTKGETTEPTPEQVEPTIEMSEPTTEETETMMSAKEELTDSEPAVEPTKEGIEPTGETAEESLVTDDTVEQTSAIGVSPPVTTSVPTPAVGEFASEVDEEKE